MPHIPDSHATHDPLVIAAYAAGDATGAQLDTAAALVAACSACAALHHDLRAITAALPATAGTAPSPRPRDFRLTADQAASLRPTGWRRLLAPFAGPSFGFARPLGTGLATLGLAGILVAGASGMPLGGAASAPGDQATGAGGGEPAVAMEKAPAGADATLAPAAVEQPAAAASADPGAMVPMAAPVESGEPLLTTGAAGGAAPAGNGSGTTEGAAGTTEGAEGADDDGEGPVARAIPAEDGSSGSPVPVVGFASLVALLGGLALLGLRYAGRRAVRLG